MVYFGNPPDPSRPQQLFPGISSSKFNPLEAGRAFTENIHNEKELRSTHQQLDAHGKLGVTWPHDRARAAKDDFRAVLESKMAGFTDLMPGYESISSAYKQLGWQKTEWGQVSGPELSGIAAARAPSSRPASAGRTGTGRPASSKRSRQADPAQLRQQVAWAVKAALAAPPKQPAQEAAVAAAPKQPAQQAAVAAALKQPAQQAQPSQPSREPCQEQLTALSLLEQQRRMSSVATPSTRKTVRAWEDVRLEAMARPAFGKQDPEIQDVTAKQTHLKGGVLRPPSRSSSSTCSTAASEGSGSRSRNFERAPSANGRLLRVQSVGLQQRPSSSSQNRPTPPSLLEKLMRPRSAQVPARRQQHSASAPSLRQDASPSWSQNQLSQILIRERCGRGGSKPLLC